MLHIHPSTQICISGPPPFSEIAEYSDIAINLLTTYGMNVIGAVLKADDRVMKSPEAAVFVGELADSSVNIVVRVWTESGNYWPLKAALTKNIKHKFDEKNISFPYPRQDIHVVSIAKSPL